MDAIEFDDCAAIKFGRADGGATADNIFVLAFTNTGEGVKEESVDIIGNPSNEDEDDKLPKASPKINPQYCRHHQCSILLLLL